MLRVYLKCIFFISLLIQVVFGQNVTNTTAATTLSANATTTTQQPFKTYQLGAYRVDWIESLDYIDFVFTTYGAALTDVYSAFGFSLDKEMVKIRAAQNPK